LKELIEQLQYGIDLRFDQAREASRQLANPGIAEEQKADFLVALKQKGESGEELGYFARSFLEMAIRPALHLQGRRRRRAETREQSDHFKVRCR
jgi:anthranilate phosphoribosyltransferase